MSTLAEERKAVASVAGPLEAAGYTTTDAGIQKELGNVGAATASTTTVNNDAAPNNNAAPSGKELSLQDVPSPKDWSSSTKTVFALVLCVWISSMTYASSAYAVSVPSIAQHFNKSREYVIAGITVYVFAFAAGPLLFGPASDLYGRRIVYLVACLCYSAASFGAAFAPSAESLIAFRFLMGFFGSASINNVIASISDFSYPAERMKLNSYYAFFSFIGPAVGPLCGAYIEQYAGFRWNLRVMAIFATACSLTVVLVPETHAPTLAARHLVKQGQPAPKVTLGKAVSAFRLALARPLSYLFTEPIVTLICVYLALLYGILYSFFGAYPYVWQDKRGFSLTSYGLTYIALALGFFAGFVLMQIRAYQVSRQVARMQGASKSTYVAPESRLSFSIPGAVLAPVSLTIFAWTAPYPNVHWFGPCFAEFLFSFSMFTVYGAHVPYLGEAYLPFAASALASGMSSRALIASVFPLFSLTMYERLTIQGASMLLAALCALLAPLPMVFIKYGARLRHRSKHAMHDPEPEKP